MNAQDGFDLLSEVFLMGPNGEDIGPLLDGYLNAVHPSGKTIAVDSNTSSARRLYDLEGNLVRGLSTTYASDFSPDGESLLTWSGGAYGPISSIDLETDVSTPLGVDGRDPQFTPDGSKVIYQRGFERSDGSNTTGIFRVNASGGGDTLLRDTGAIAGLSMSPSGTKIVYSDNYGDNLVVMSSDGSGPETIAAGPSGLDYSYPRFSPDGTKIVATKWDRRGDANDWSVVVMDIAGGGERTVATGDDMAGDFPAHNLRPIWLPQPSTLKLKLETRRVDDGDDVFDVVMTIRAGNESAVENLRFTDPKIIESSAAGFPEDEQSAVVKISGPDKPIPSELDVNQESTHVWTYQVTKPGRVALYSELTGYATKDGVDETDGHTVIAETAESTEPDPSITPQLLAMGAIDQYLIEAYEAYLADNDMEARRILRWAKKKLNAQQRKLWLGHKKKIKVSPAERAFADRFNISPELAAVLLPDRSKLSRPARKKMNVPSDAEIAALYWEGYRDEMLKIGKSRLKGAWKKGKQKVKNGWLGSVAMVNYLNGDASPEERAQIEALALTAWDDSITKEGWLEEEVRRCLCANFPWASAVIDSPLRKVTSDDVNSLWNDVTLQSEDLRQQLVQEEIALKNIYKGKNIRKNLKKHGAQGAQLTYSPVETIAGVAFGRAAEPVVGIGVKKVGGIMRVGKGTGVTKGNGKIRKGPSKVKNDPIGKTGARPSAADIAGRNRIGDPSDTLRHHENIGGIPVREAEIQREIIAEIEAELGLPQGQVGLALKESSPYRKNGSVAKFELVKVKTGKAVHAELGLDPDAISEPAFFRPKSPNQLPEWKNLPAAQRRELSKTYQKSLKEYKDWTSGSPSDPDLAKLSKATQRVGGPKLTEPVTIELSHGRTARAIFEEVPVKGTDTIRIRAKYYEVDGIVFLDAKKAKPMGPDLDAVAIYDAKSSARFTDRQLETKIVRAYRKKIAERVKAGEQFHGAEHGLTLIMDDVPAGPGGSVGNLMQYGLPYLPEEAATAFAKRIEPFVEMTAEEILDNVDKFGKELVNVTSTSVYYGKLPLDQW